MTAKKNKYFILFILVPFLLSGCLGIQHLKGDEKLLYYQKIEAPRTIEKDPLRNLYAQQENRKLFGLAPIHYLVWLYYTGQRRYNKDKFIRKKEKVEAKFNKKLAATDESNIKKINNLQFKKLKKTSKLDSKIEKGNMFMQWGEPLTIADTAKIQLTVLHFKDYLASKGYFQNEVSYDIKTYKTIKSVYVIYKVTPGKAYFIDTIFYQINDTAVYNLIAEHEKASLIKQGDRYDQDNFTKERERIDLLLKDYGYYDFSRQYIEFDVDTSMLEDQNIAVRVTIKDPAKRDYHKQFTITEVNFVTDAGATRPGTERNSRNYRNIHYSFYKDDYNLRILSQRVFLRPGNLYSRSRTFDTQRQLANLDAFKFVNINYDTAGGKFVANIYTSPLDRYQWSNEAGVSVTQGFPGPFYNMTFKKRNVFRGLESFELSGHFGFQGVASATSEENIYKSTEAGVNASMTFPQIIFPLGERTQLSLGRRNPKTRIQVGYSYTDRPEYRRTYASFSGTYSVENRKATQYSLTFANLSVIDTLNTSGDFRRFLEEQATAGNFSLVNAFYPSFVTSMIFNITWNHNNYGNLDKSSTFVRTSLESGGTIWNFVDPEFITSEGLQYFKYLRLSLDVRRNRVINKNTILAFRFNSGVAYAYGANKSVPYEKFFFAGGSNSIRAWRPRRLGPGSYKPNISSDTQGNGLFDYSIEKPAEILLEGSIELRKNLFGFVDGAVFVDAGNVWSFREWVKKEGDVTVPNGNSKFYWNRFYREIGVGTGFGLRFDFTFLILRFDVGIKMYDPAREGSDRFVLHRVRFFKPYGTEKEPVIYNVGIGFPF